MIVFLIAITVLTMLSAGCMIFIKKKIDHELPGRADDPPERRVFYAFLLYRASYAGEL